VVFARFDLIESDDGSRELLGSSDQLPVLVTRSPSCNLTFTSSSAVQVRGIVKICVEFVRLFVSESFCWMEVSVSEENDLLLIVNR
jgi:hypothetical protein